MQSPGAGEPPAIAVSARMPRAMVHTAQCVRPVLACLAGEHPGHSDRVPDAYLTSSTDRPSCLTRCARTATCRAGDAMRLGITVMPRCRRRRRQGYLETAFRPALNFWMKALSWGTTSGSESSARSSWFTSCGVSRRIRSSASTARERSIAAPKTNDVRSCCCTLAAARTVSRASGLSRRLIRADFASDMTDASFSLATT